MAQSRLQLGRPVAILLLIFTTQLLAVTGQECQYNSFADVLSGRGDTFLFKTALGLSGYQVIPSTPPPSPSHAITHPAKVSYLIPQDKLPSPSSDIAITMLVPSNKALLSLLWKNGFFLPVITSVSSDLASTMLYNVLLGALTPDQIISYTDQSMGTAPTVYGLLAGSNGYNMQYYSNEDGGNRNYYFKPTVNGGLAGATTAIQVCNSWIYVTDEMVVPSSDEKLSGVQTVTIPDNLPWGPSSSSSSPAPSPPVAAPAPILPPPPPSPPACIIPGGQTPVGDNTTATPPAALPAAPAPAPCNTTFAAEANAAGLSILSTALGQPSIAAALPDPSQPNTLFAPVDTAFLSMLTTLSECPWSCIDTPSFSTNSKFPPTRCPFDILTFR